nr:MULTISPECIES: ROK family transcriptional regulator [unclassified Actinomyces]
MSTASLLATTRPAGPRAHTDVRVSNLSLILRTLKAGPLSRTALSQTTGLSKATVSTLVGDLTGLGLVTEGRAAASGSVGRPSTSLHVSAGAVAGVGLEISPDCLLLTTTDLTGQVLAQRSKPVQDPSRDPEAVIARIGVVLAEELVRLARAGTAVPAVVLAQPGLLDYDTGRVHYSSAFDWHDIALASGVAEAIGLSLTEAGCRQVPVPPVLVEHDARLAALAVHDAFPQVRNLLYLSGGQGIGAGIVADGHVLHGWMGYTGEVGHMPVEPDGALCQCGRRGCWETLIGFESVVSVYPDDDPVRDVSQPVGERTVLLRERFEQGDPVLEEQLAGVQRSLERGLSVLVDVLNPEVVVLSGWLAAFADVLLEPTAAALEERRLDVRSLVRLEVSALGEWAPSCGAARVALETVLEDPTAMEDLTPLACRGRVR